LDNPLVGLPLGVDFSRAFSVTIEEGACKTQNKESSGRKPQILLKNIAHSGNEKAPLLRGPAFFAVPKFISQK